MRVIEMQHTFTIVESEERSARSQTKWRVLALAAFILSGMSFLIGAVISFLAALSLLPPTKLTAYATVSMLFAAFLLAFFFAHAMDKLERLKG